MGDVNSTMAATLAAVKLGLKVAHLEAGLRSFDRSMPEEINRVVTDVLADILWTPSWDADENLKREGITEEKIQCVGNIMIDSLEMLRETIQAQKVYREMNFAAGGYGLLTLHRPSNVDNPQVLTELCHSLFRISKDVPLIFPIHPRTRKNLEHLDLITSLNKNGRLIISEPMNYIRFMNLLFNSRFTITDSGGIQEETTYLGIPCLTLRPNTERPITISQGTNRLCDLFNLEKNIEDILSKRVAKKPKIELWDGKTAGRVINSIRQFLLI